MSNAMFFILLRFASKGFIYAVLDYQGTNLHVFATHLQSDDTSYSAGKAAMYRAQALGEWRKFIDSRQISSNELVITVGDFNINRNTAEFNTTLVEKFQVHQPDAYDGYGFTWDPIEVKTSRDWHGVRSVTEYQRLI